MDMYCTVEYGRRNGMNKIKLISTYDEKEALDTEYIL